MDDKKNVLLYAIITILVVVLLSILIYTKFLATIQSKVYFADQQASYLIAKNKTVKKNSLYNNLIKELIKGPTGEDLVATIPPQTKLLGVEVKDKTAVVNFSKELKETHWGGTAGETMTVYSVVNTLAQFNEIDKVKILIEGQEIETLAGHMELSQALSFNSTIIKSE